MAGAGRDRGERPGWGLRGLAIWLGAVVAVGLLFFAYHYLGPLVEGQARRPLAPLIEELTGAFAAGLSFFALRLLVRRLPLTRTRWPRRAPLYLLAMVGCGAAATTVMWGLRSLLFPLAGLGPYDYGAMPLRYLMELPLQLIAFVVIAGALHAYDALEAARQRELLAARIESSLARTQLRNLRLQLQPHFLFNALHTISSVMYQDPAAADEMLEQLAELLRSSLRTAQSDEVPLAEELALLARYVALQRARFGERLAVEIEVDPGAEALLVPSLLLQPLVENAIRHGSAERSGRGAVAVRARLEGHRLVIEVENDAHGGLAATGAREGSKAIGRNETPVATGGNETPVATGDESPAAPGGEEAPGERLSAPGVPASPGLGLAATAERLLLLYGDRQSFSAGRLAGGGFLVRACLPARPAGAAAGAA
jgi:two-component system LytT family sensor kinase